MLRLIRILCMEKLFLQWATIGTHYSRFLRFYDNHVLFDDYTGVVLDTSEGDRIAEALGDKKAAYQNHGLLTTGTTVDEAAWDLSMDRCCQSQLLAET